MIYLDTNVLVRFAVRDNEMQFRLAQQLILANEVMVLTGTLVEFEWVMRSLYGIRRSGIADALRRICGMPGLAVDEEVVIERAIAAYSIGFDLADAVFIVQAEMRGGDRFATFDKKLLRKCRDISTTVAAFRP